MARCAAWRGSGARRQGWSRSTSSSQRSAASCRAAAHSSRSPRPDCARRGGTRHHVTRERWHARGGHVGGGACRAVTHVSLPRHVTASPARAGGAGWRARACCAHEEGCAVGAEHVVYVGCLEAREGFEELHLLLDVDHVRAGLWQSKQPSKRRSHDARTRTQWERWRCSNNWH